MVTKTGTSANDTLYGGPGGDQLVGLGGDDTYGVYSQLDTVIEQPNEGNDRVLTFASYALTAGASVETLSTAINAGTDPIQLTGNEVSQFIIGNFGANTIDGRGGGDAMVGLAGNDVYYVSGRTDFVFEAAGGGTDIVYARGDFVLNAGSSVERIEAEDRTSTLGLFLGGNELSQDIYGSAGSDIINGGGQQRGVQGDILYGGAGDDIYRLFGDNQSNGGSSESVFEVNGEGTDAVYTSGSFKLTAYSSVELLSTANNSGTEAINLTGNGVGQVIIGNYGDNQIFGYVSSGGLADPGPYSGADTLIGLFGNDTYRVYSQSDVVVEQAGQGTDSVYTDFDYTLRSGTSVELLSTSLNAGIGALRFGGNEIANTLIGNFGANTLDGGSGNDTLMGLDGADVFRFSTALGSGNVDTILDFGRGADSIQLDRAIFSTLSLGTLPASALAYGPAALDADDRVVYDPATGAVSYDADGNGTGSAIQFASLSANLAQSAIQVTVVAPPDAGMVSIVPGGTYRIGGAAGAGTSIADVYPDATSVTFGRSSGRAAEYSFAFGPDSVSGRPQLNFAGGVVDTLDFSQLGTGLNFSAATEYKTTSGATILPVWTYQTDFDRVVTVYPKTIIGSPFADVIDRTTVTSTGENGDGIVRGGAGNDSLKGGSVLYGEEGDDRLTGIGFTELWGGAGRDTFVLPIYSPAFSGTRPNLPKDFNPAEDRIELVLNIASDLPVGELAAGRFGIGSVATTADQRILYDPFNGVLRFDANGSLPDTTDQRPIFAVLPPGLDLTHISFNVILP